MKETPYLREPITEYGVLEYSLDHFENATYYLKKALQISKNTKTYINEPYCYDGSIEDTLAVCLYYRAHREESYRYAKKASIMKPHDKRIQENLIKIERDL